MTRNYTYQKGSTHVVVTIILVVVILGLLGFIFWQNFIKNSDNKVADSSPSQSDGKTNGDAAERERSADWLMYTSVGSHYKVAIPDNWKLTAVTSEDNLLAFEAKDIVYKKGTPATVKQEEGGRGYSSIAFYLLYNYTPNEGAYLSPSREKVKTYTTKHGVQVEKYTEVINVAEGEVWMGPPNGTKEYTYDLYKNGIRIHIVHDVLAGEAEQTALIEDMIDTLEYR